MCSRARSRLSPYPRFIKTSFLTPFANGQLRAAVVNSASATADTPPVQWIVSQGITVTAIEDASPESASTARTPNTRIDEA
ncbi:hypothetical protein SCLCIDRAFT_1224959 [Scleroderma citrinum Foug A]|uniref:Uncharacterized protein n=1 Tax=Scleroderma citrinum Foug A TaxID=1036808 RepID=A0A0C2YMK1_9AGAM|nr:hypothetical protein SCLCIDRAFT_1224959 [Scleroderma citrinum Foug A]